MITTPHKHRPKAISIVPFSGPVVADQDRRAHGGHAERQVCRCGAVRTVNVNGRWAERGPWSESASEAECLS